MRVIRWNGDCWRRLGLCTSVNFSTQIDCLSTRQAVDELNYRWCVRSNAFIIRISYLTEKMAAGFLQNFSCLLWFLIRFADIELTKWMWRIVVWSELYPQHFASDFIASGLDLSTDKHICSQMRLKAMYKCKFAETERGLYSVPVAALNRS